MTTVHTRTCHICEANCGILVELDGTRVVSIKGDPDDVLSRGHICPKATAIADLEEDPDRLRTPVKRVGADWVPVSWEDAFADIGARYAAIKAGGGEGALYIGNPNAHSYANGMAFPGLKKALGTPNVFSASTVDQIPQQLINMWVYGHNALWPIPDIDRTMLMVVIGANPFASNGSTWTVPGVKERVKALKARGGRLVVIDPRRTETADAATTHLFVRPGTDAALLIALLLALDEAGLVRPGRLSPMLEGFEETLVALRRFEVPVLANWCGMPEDAIRALAADLGSGTPAVVYGRMGVSTAEFGTLNHWLIQLLNIATGNLDREGGAMFSSPAIDLVAGSGAGNRGRHRSRVSGYPELLGEYPVVALAEEITTPGEGQVKALVVVAGNPVLSCPDGQALDVALETLDLMVSVDMYVTETSRHAHYILPPCGPLAKDHYPLALGPIAVRNFAKYSSALRPLEPGEKTDWDILAELSRALAGARGLPVPNPVPPRVMLDGMLKRQGLSLDMLEAHPHGLDLGPLEAGRLPERLKDGVIHCAPAECLADLDRLAARMAEPDTGLRLIGRRHIRSNNSWLHNSKRLLKGPERCTAMLHPDDAGPRGISDGAMVRLETAAGSVEVVAEVTDAVMPGTVSLPHGFGHGREGVRLSVARQRPGVSLNDLTRRDRFDPLSGNAALNGTPVEVVLAA
jgi:anaerobic selenocysteine-containing dehydrogenase